MSIDVVRGSLHHGIFNLDAADAAFPSETHLVGMIIAGASFPVTVITVALAHVHDVVFSLHSQA